MFSWQNPSKIPLVVAHRGASAVAPENTLSAIRQAINDGADAVEIDARLSKDREVVIIHDSFLARTTNGKGRVHLLTLKELKRLDAGSWFHKKFSFERIPTLREVFEVIDKRIGVNIEVKATTSVFNYFNIVEECLKIIEEYNAVDIVMISSFRSHFVYEAKTHTKKVTGGLLFSNPYFLGIRQANLVKKVQADYIICDKSSLNKKRVEDAHKLGVKVGVFTINNREDFKKVQRLNVDTIFTDNPGKIREFMNE